MAVTDWVSNLFQSEQTRGLSGGNTAAVALDDSNPYYNYRLRRHRTDGDLVGDPSLIWYTSQFVESRHGLGVHIAVQATEPQLTYTDVLLILSLDDYDRIAQVDGEPWLPMATRVLLEHFEQLCEREGFQARFPDRKLGFRILCDGSADMGGQSLGLASGEFVTGLLPNLYTGPVSGSAPVIGVHINLPGVWDDYQEIGRLYSDQALFTLGSSWLDNFSHPSLCEAALYRLQRKEGGGFSHIINPDLQDRYQISAAQQEDASVLTISTMEGEPLLFMVLALLDQPAPAEDQPEIAAPMLIDNQVQEVLSGLSGRRPGHTLTVLPDAPQERIFTLQERGALLQKVHFRNFMEGYDVYLGHRGELGTVVDDKAATFQVRRREVRLVAHTETISLDGSPVPIGTSVVLDKDCEIRSNGQRLEYHYLRGLRVDKWPYVAELRRPASSNYLFWGQRYRIGRASDTRVVLPDQADNSNIHWKPEVADGAYIRARTGDIEKSRFYTDSIMVSSSHAEIDLTQEEAAVACVAKACFVYVRRDGAVFPLYATATGKQPTEMSVQPGDELLIGNCLFHVGYTPVGPGVAPRPAPQASLSADLLVAAVSAPDFAEASDDGIIAANALGEHGFPPAPPVLDSSGPDSILGESPFVDDGPIRAEISFEDGEPSAKPLAAKVEWEEPIEHSPPPVQHAPPPAPPVVQQVPPPAPPAPSAAESAPPPPPRTVTPPAAQQAPPPPAPPVHTRAPESAPPPPPRAVTPPAPPAPEPDAPKVIAVDEDEAQFELGRPMHLVLSGWMVAGEVICGNHTGADLLLPENRIEDDQVFEKRDYFKLKVRGRRSKLTPITRSEFLYDELDVAEEPVSGIEEVPIDIIRRDDAGEEDFGVRLELYEDGTLPNPRARMLAIDIRDKLTSALVTLGLPLNQPRRLKLGAIQMDATFNGERIQVSNYLDSYALGGGKFEPFFVQHGDDKFHTAPEDGSEISLGPDDRLIIGMNVYQVRGG